jgi:hypothetical protein
LSSILRRVSKYAVLDQPTTAGARVLGFELDVRIFQLSQQNATILKLPIEMVNIDYQAGLACVSLASDDLLIAFIAPPWGEALSTGGLDLRATTPAVPKIVGGLIDRFPRNRMLCAIQTYETMNAESVVDVKRRFDWSTTKLFQLNGAGQNHGLLLGTKGWTPSF